MKVDFHQITVYILEMGTHFWETRFHIYYIDLFANDAVFFGTDISERWPKVEFNEYATEIIKFYGQK